VTKILIVLRLVKTPLEMQLALWLKYYYRLDHR